LLDDSDDDFSLRGLVSLPIIQLTPISVKTVMELYHFVVIHIMLFVTFLKLMMLFDGLLFVRVNDSYSICTIDNTEIFPLTPRYLALFTVSFLSFSEYIGKTVTDLTQYNFQRGCPFLISALHTSIVVMRRRQQLTVDDIFIAIVFMCSFFLYLGSEQRAKQLRKAMLLRQQQAVEAARKAGEMPGLYYKDAYADRRRYPEAPEYEEQYCSENEDDPQSSEPLQFLQSLIENAYPDKVEFHGVPTKQLIEKLASQYGDLNEAEEKIRKILQMNNQFEAAAEEEMQHPEMFEQFKQRTQQFQQATQGGQGQQASYPVKQTAHKAPTKAPSGRPNPRKRR
jgi:hypothetical protein